MDLELRWVGGSRVGKPSVLTICLPSPPPQLFHKRKKYIYIYNIDSFDFQDLSPSLSPLKTVMDGVGVTDIHVLEQKKYGARRECPINLRETGGRLRLQGGGRGSCLVPLVLKCFPILFRGELQEEK